MSNMLRILLCTAIVLAWQCLNAAQAQVVVDFQDAVLPGGGVLAANGADAILTSRGAGFNADWYEPFNCCAAGWAFSNHTNALTPGFGNTFSAITGSGFGSTQYGVAFEDVFGASIPRINLPAGLRPESIRITNTTYAYFSIRDGNDGGAGFVRQFGDFNSLDGPTGNAGAPDYFKLTITGEDALGASTGSVDFYLADYRFANNALDYVVNDWRLVDLTSLGSNTRVLRFNLESTDVGQFGANTPFYFAADDLRLVQPTTAAVPEPSSLMVMLGAAAFAALCRLCWRRK